MTPLLHLRGIDVMSSKKRELIRGLSLTLGREKAALVGRNGVGKSSLLRVLAGWDPPARGTIRWSVTPHFVPQEIGGQPGDGLSPGARRRILLHEAQKLNPPLLLLDEPTEDLDAQGKAWLRSWLQAFEGGLLVATHDRALLSDLNAFCVVEEAGCSFVSGDLQALENHLMRRQDAAERAYAKRISGLARAEKKSDAFRRRRQRKAQVGRAREIDRMTPRTRLNQKRSYAQENQGRIDRVRQARIAAQRELARAARRALRTELPLEATLPELPHRSLPIIELRDVAVGRDGVTFIRGLNLAMGRERIAVLGSNGAGKSSLLQTIAGELTPRSGRVHCDRERVGYVDQGASHWIDEESLLEQLCRLLSLDSAAEVVAAHRFPLSLAARPLSTLSPGERVRAALISIFQRDPAVEILILDEPTQSLDFLGRSALTALLRAWPGGLLIATHDIDFLSELAVTSRIVLDDPAAVSPASVRYSAE
ncbi:MAG: ATP-binding cassette domain-containing protein [Myxococcota bacterium]